MKQIEIYTDGSCKGNPGPGGWAAIFLEKKSKTPFKILKGHAIDTTNNRMEMTAVIEALRHVDKEKLHASQCTLYSDSNLIIQTLLQGWKRKANLDLWEELDDLNEELDVQYVWVKGHAKNHWNNECDKVAQKESLVAQKLAHKKGPARQAMARHPSSGPAPARRKTSSIQSKLF